MDHHPTTGSRQLKAASILAILLMATVYLLPTVSDAVLGLSLLLVFLTVPDRHRLVAQVSGDRLLRCAGVLLLYLLISSFWSVDPDPEDINKQLLRIVMLLAYLIVVASASREDPRFNTLLARGIGIGLTLSTLICLYYFYADPPEDERMLGLNRFNNTGRVGGIMAASLPFTLMGLWLDRGHWRILAAIALAIGIFGLVQTGTRGAWLAAIVSLSVYTVTMLEQRPLRVLVIATVCLVLTAAALGLVMYIPEWRDVVFPRGDSFRTNIWMAHIRDIRESAAVYGWGQLTDHKVDVGQYTFRGAHNMYLSVTGHIGLPGLLLFLTVLGWIAVRLYQSLHLTRARLGLCLIMGGAANFMFSGDRLIDKVNFVWFVLWFPLALALSIRSDAGSQTSDPASPPSDGLSPALPRR